MHDPRLDKLADILVTYSTNVKKGDVVLIKGPTISEQLLVTLTRRVLKAGGHPVVRCTIDAVEEQILKHASNGQLQYLSPADVDMFDQCNVYIGVWADENTRALSKIDPKKQQVRAKARQPLLDKMMKRAAAKGKRKLRWVGTQFPCMASAQDADMSLEDYAEFVFRGGLLHLPNPVAAWRKLERAQKRVCDYLNKVKEVRFVSPNGTDLRVGVAGRKWINCGGENNFPDGEVFSGPVENATEGEVRYSFPAVHDGREVTDVWLKFKGGKVVDADASKNRDFLYAMLDMDPGARRLGEIAIGTNYSIKDYTCNTLFDEKIGGTFHAAVGAAYPESGGKNKSALHWDMVCDLRKGGRIEADGKVISRNGRFINKTWPQPSRSR